MRFQLLGPVRAWSDGRPVSLGVRRQRFVLALLALEANRLVPISRLVDLVWPDSPPKSARAMVHTRVSGLRSIFDRQGAFAHGVALVSEPDGYALRCDFARVDAYQFRRQVAMARAEPDHERRVSLFDEALALWRGPALTGVTVEATRARLCQHLDDARLAAIEDRAEALLHLGRHRELVNELVAIVEDNPHRQRLTGQLMLALHRCARPDEALRIYDRIRHELAEELGLDPGDALQRLHESILRDDPDLAGPTAGSPAVTAPGTGPVRPMQLPADLACFTGRESQLRQLDLLLGAGADRPAAVVISAIEGTAGVGKTALAIHWAHRVANRFPDGQLYVNLRGFDPSDRPLAAATAVRGFLDALGVAPQRIPLDLDAQSALFRSLLAGKRIMVVLDNARDASQVRPLLPGAPGCLALVTSRCELTGLVTAEGAQPLALDLLPAAEARQMLVNRLGADRVSVEPEAIDEIVTVCARLPLALAVAAARAATHPHQPLSDLASDLRAAQLDSFYTGDPATDVRAVFSWSSHCLGAGAARLFRLLGLYPGADISAPAAASLAGTSLADTRRSLAELTRAHLVAEHVNGRYNLHDLLRAYAAELARTAVAPADRRAAVHRLLDHYLHTAYSAAVLINPPRHPIALAAPQPHVIPERLADHRHAQSWLTAEHHVLLAAIQLAVDADFRAHAWQLAWTVVDFLDRRGHWHEQLTTQRTAMAAAERLRDPVGLAHAYRHVAYASMRLGRFVDAHTHFRHSLDLFDELADVVAQAHTHLNISVLCERQDNQREALSHGQRALQLFRAAGHGPGQARALSTVGWYHTQLGNHAQALVHCQQALALHRGAGDRLGQASTWDSLGCIHRSLGDHRRAIDCYRHALRLLREDGTRYHEAVTLAHLGDVYDITGQPGAARAAWQQALDIFDHLDHPDADQVRTKLHPRARVE